MTLFICFLLAIGITLLAGLLLFLVALGYALCSMITDHYSEGWAFLAGIIYFIACLTFIFYGAHGIGMLMDFFDITTQINLSFK